MTLSKIHITFFEFKISQLIVYIFAMETSIRDSTVIIGEFNTIVRGLITKVEKKSRREEEIANLDRLKKRITLLKQTIGDYALISEASPFFIEYSEQILIRDEKFFETMDVRTEYMKRVGGNVKREDEFIFDLIKSVREHYKKATQTEKDDVYVDVKTLFKCCVEYKLSIS